MHPRERILGMMKLCEQHQEPIPQELRDQAKRWKVEVPGDVTNLEDYKQTKKEKTAND